MTRRTVILTGATSGIGFQAARALLAEDGDLILVVAGRDEARIRAVSRRLHASRAVPRLLDLGSLVSVHEFTRRLREECSSGVLPPLHTIVCNAGLQVIGPVQYSTDGFERTFAVNHLGHFALVLALLEITEPSGRIVVVGSDTHDPSLDTGMPAPRFDTARAVAQGQAYERVGDSGLGAGRIRYTTSKLCNLMFAAELARRLGGSPQASLTVNAFNPGLTPGTGLARGYPAVMRFAFRHVLPIIARTTGRFNSPGTQGRALARLVLDPGLADVTGAYFSGLARDKPSAEARDAEKAHDLWITSLDLVQSACPPLYQALSLTG